MDNHPNIIHGAPLERLVDIPLGNLISMFLKTQDDNILLVDAYTHEEIPANILLAKSIELAKWLKNANIGIGDCVCLNSENRIEFPITVFATFLVGATFAALNPDYTPTELNHVIKLSKPKIMFCSGKTINKIIKIKSAHSYIQKLVLYDKLSSNNASIPYFDDIIHGVTEVDESFQPPELDIKNTVATILCSSGTTGLPKGVICTHDNMGAFIDVGRTQLDEVATVENTNYAAIGLTPFFHSFGFMVMLLNILRGKKTIVMKKFNLKVLLESIVRYKIRSIMVPPPILVILLKNPLVNQYDITCLQEIRCGAASLGKDMEKELRTRFKVKDVSQNYGMTETTLSVLSTVDGAHKLGSVGKLVAGMKVKVINEKGEPLGAFQEGELCFKGPLIMKGYVDNLKATAETIDRNGWLHTGDVAYYDEEKFFFIVDRIKELIKYNGFQVAPAELEALLLTHSGIEDAAVVGLPDEDAGELPLAFVVKKNGSKITEEEVKIFVASKLSPQKQLRGGVIFVQEIPKNPTGKILRRVLRDQVKDLVRYKAKL